MRVFSREIFHENRENQDVTKMLNVKSFASGAEHSRENRENKIRTFGIFVKIQCLCGFPRAKTLKTIDFKPFSRRG